MSTKLVIEFDKRSLGSPPGDEGYYMRTKVDEPETTPDSLETCLVYSTAVGERIVRVATLAELTSINEAPLGHTTFKAASLAGTAIQDGDVIRVVTAPRLWTEIGFVVPTDYTVAAGGVLIPDAEVVVTSSFPSYMENLEFELWRGVTKILPVGANPNPTDGIAERTYPGTPPVTPDPEYRVKEHYDLFTDLTVAQTTYDTIVGLAQSLVNEYNEDRWSTGVTEETFE